MRIYVETNFLLEWVLEQEQYTECEALLRLAETASTVHLVVPTYCLTEPFDTLQRRQRERRKLGEQLERELKEIKRTQRFTAEVDSSTVAGLLVRSSQEAAQRLDSITKRLLRIAQILPLTAEVMAGSLEYRRLHGLLPADALVLASILCDPDLGRESSCFLNRNTKDFGEKAIIELLERQSCKLIFRFDQGLEYVQSTLGAGV